jgi:hypothetical protein
MCRIGCSPRVTVTLSIGYIAYMQLPLLAWPTKLWSSLIQGRPPSQKLSTLKTFDKSDAQPLTRRRMTFPLRPDLKAMAEAQPD